tara:strand:+ start:453 stop:647 length:195 start_codon:yes stop_codon:yes gene_type:complete
LGTSIKNNIHQQIIKNPTVAVMIIFLKKIQLKIKTKIPKVIIDQGWHQYGFKFQNVFLVFESIE